MIDIQINGYAGVDFQGDAITPEQMAKVAAALKAHRTERIFPTFITDAPARMARSIAAFSRVIDQEPAWRAMMPAVHIEGPCLSPEEGYRGAHPHEHMVAASPEVFEPMIEAAGGPGRVAIVTLAPEVDPGLKTTRWLAEQGITVSAGHTNAPLDTLREAARAGLSMFTHLSNGCKAEIPRHDNIINRALSLETLTYCFIPDGYHVPFWLLKMWVKWVGVERCIFTSDCMSAAAAGPGRYRIGKWELEVGEDKLVHPPGATHLAGSAITMADAWANAVGPIGLSEAEARMVTQINPGKVVPGVPGVPG